MSSDAGLPVDSNLTDSKGTSPSLPPLKPIRRYYPKQQQLLRHSSSGRSPSNSRRRQLLATTDTQAAVIAQASSTVQLSSISGASVHVREPQGRKLQPYGQTNIVFEVGQRACACSSMSLRVAPQEYPECSRIRPAQVCRAMIVEQTTKCEAASLTHKL